MVSSPTEMAVVRIGSSAAVDGSKTPARWRSGTCGNGGLGAASSQFVSFQWRQQVCWCEAGPPG